ncbi:unnamed protein product, partial [Brachionus calyciflorus]
PEKNEDDKTDKLTTKYETNKNYYKLTNTSIEQSKNEIIDEETFNNSPIRPSTSKYALNDPGNIVLPSTTNTTATGFNKDKQKPSLPFTDQTNFSTILTPQPIFESKSLLYNSEFSPEYQTHPNTSSTIKSSFRDNLTNELRYVEKPMRLDASTPRFSGNPKDVVDDWLFMIKQGFISSRIKEEDKLNSIVNYVSELPLLILRRHIEANSSWLGFELKISKTFKNIDKEHKIRSDLSVLKHKDNMSIESYINRFLTLINKLPLMAEEEKIFYFKEGLKDNIKKEIICRGINRETITCTRCKRKAHYAKKCRVRLDKINQIRITEYSDNDVDKIYVVKTDNKGIPSLIGKIQGISLKVGIDCGATHSVMNHMTAIANNFEIFRTNNSIKTATGTVTKASGRTRLLEVDIGGNISMIEFIVFDHEDHDILLGMDWFHKTQSGIFPSQGIIKFPDFELNIKSHQSSRIDVFEVFTSEIEESEKYLDYLSDNPELKMVPEIELDSKQLNSFNELKGEASSLCAHSIQTSELVMFTNTPLDS